MRNIDQLTQEELLWIGDKLGYIPQTARRKAKRFLIGCQGKLKNWNYDEVINYGEMGKVIEVFNYLSNIKVKIS